MGHEGGNRHLCEGCSSGASDNELAKSRMAVPAHDDQVGSSLGGIREDPIRNIHLGCTYLLRSSLQLMKRQVIGNGASGGALDGLAIAGGDDLDRFRAPKEWQ